MKANRKTKKRFVYVIVIILAVAVVSLLLLRPKPIPYKSVAAKTGDIETYLSFSGNIETKSRQTVISDKIMQISAILVQEGSTVKTGDVLIKTTAGDKIVSKIDGEVANISVEANTQVMSGTKLLEIVDYNNLKVKVKVDEYDISALETGKEATVKIGALNKTIKGTIVSMSKEGLVANGITYFTATIDLQKDPSLKIGMSTDVTLLSNEAKGVVTLPMVAISFDENNSPFVLKQTEKRKAIKTSIITGINDGTAVEVKSGVLNGETILYTNASATTNMGFSGESRVRSNGGGA